MQIQDRSDTLRSRSSAFNPGQLRRLPGAGEVWKEGTWDFPRRGCSGDALYAPPLLPQVFAQVTMLYVSLEVNGVQVKAFVDSGAQVRMGQARVHGVRRRCASVRVYVGWGMCALPCHMPAKLPIPGTSCTSPSQACLSPCPVLMPIELPPQMTIMTSSFVQKCFLARLIDKRFKGMAVGVGSSPITGRVHQVDGVTTMPSEPARRKHGKERGQAEERKQLQGRQRDFKAD
jgi:hypothetical protein